MNKKSSWKNIFLIKFLTMSMTSSLIAFPIAQPEDAPGSDVPTILTFSPGDLHTELKWEHYGLVSKTPNEQRDTELQCYDSSQIDPPINNKLVSYQSQISLQPSVTKCFWRFSTDFERFSLLNHDQKHYENCRKQAIEYDEDLKIISAKTHPDPDHVIAKAYDHVATNRCILDLQRDQEKNKNGDPIHKISSECEHYKPATKAIRNTSSLTCVEGYWNLTVKITAHYIPAYVNRVLDITSVVVEQPDVWCGERVILNVPTEGIPGDIAPYVQRIEKTLIGRTISVSGSAPDDGGTTTYRGSISFNSNTSLTGSYTTTWKPPAGSKVKPQTWSISITGQAPAQ